VGRVRRLNEDSIATPQLMGITPSEEEERGSLFVVADGMGGHAAGEVASQTAVEVIFAEYYAGDQADCAAALRSAIEAANASILSRAALDMEKGGMGTTVVAALFRGAELTVANVGDSRAYLVRNGRMRQISRDHSWVAESVAEGLISEFEAQSHPHRSLITRSLGAQPRVEVDLFQERLRPGDSVVLCSDGLTNELSDGAIMRAVMQDEPAQAAAALVKAANEGQGRDNVSVVVVGVPGGRKHRWVMVPLLLAVLAVLTFSVLLITGVLGAWRSSRAPTATIRVQGLDTQAPATATVAPVTVEPVTSVATATPREAQPLSQQDSPLPTARPLPPVTPTSPGTSATVAGEVPFPIGPVAVHESWVCEGTSCADRQALKRLGLILGYGDKAAAQPKLWLQASSESQLYVLPHHVDRCLLGKVGTRADARRQPSFQLGPGEQPDILAEAPPASYATALVLGHYVDGGFLPSAGIACETDQTGDCINFIYPRAGSADGVAHLWFQADGCQSWVPLPELEGNDGPVLVYGTWDKASGFSMPGEFGQAAPAVFVWNDDTQMYVHFSEPAAGIH
jgi:serine/threonine protein phosphatase PrpC